MLQDPRNGAARLQIRPEREGAGDERRARPAADPGGLYQALRRHDPGRRHQRAGAPSACVIERCET
jgi:hypothetical protein